MKPRTLHKPLNKWAFNSLIFNRIGRFIFAWAMTIITNRLIEFGSHYSTLGFITEFWNVIVSALIQDINFFLKSVPVIALLVGSINQIFKKSGFIICTCLFVLSFCLIYSLSLYFNKTSVLLGADLFGYSWKDLIQTLGTSFFSKTTTIKVIGFALICVLIVKIQMILRIGTKWVFRMVFFCTFFLFIGAIPKPIIHNEYAQNLSSNKATYFLYSLFNNIWHKTPFNSDIQQSNANFKPTYFPNKEYPFYRTDYTPDVLGIRMKQIERKPNFIFIVVEGLGRAFSGENAYLGSFTPFLDSLAKQSLYWENFLSEGGRTFAVLPSLLGSLPFGKTGFNDLKPIPTHYSLISILQKQGYTTSFFHGGNSNFDNSLTFLKQNRIEKMIDETNFGGKYEKMPSTNGFTWGYADYELFRRYLEEPTNSTPRLDILQTLSSHSPFLLKNQEKYKTIFQNHLIKIKLNTTQLKYVNEYTQILETILYVDDAIKYFLQEFSKRPDFKNTIFIITGDHRLPEIPLATKLDRYHVPLIIYSPMLKKNARFASISTHFDVAPTIMAYLATNYQIQRPKYTHWLGDGLDTSTQFRNTHVYPFMMTKLQLVDFIAGNYWLNGNDAFKIDHQMNLEKINDPNLVNRLRKELQLFERCNQKISNTGRLMP